MSGRDDMVLRPTIREVHGTDAAARSRVGRRVPEQAEGRGLFARLARQRAARRLAEMRRSRGAASHAATRRMGGRGGRSMTGRLIGGAGKMGRFMFNPATAAGMVGLAAGMYATSRATGVTMSEIGQFLNNIMLGDIDDEGRARTIAAQKVISDPNVAQFIGRRSVVDKEIQDALRLMTDAERPQQIGASRISTEFPAVDDFELYLRAIERGFSKGWDAKEGQEAARHVLEAISNTQSGGLGSGGMR